MLQSRWMRVLHQLGKQAHRGHAFDCNRLGASFLGYQSCKVGEAYLMTCDCKGHALEVHLWSGICKVSVAQRAALCEGMSPLAAMLSAQCWAVLWASVQACLPERAGSGTVRPACASPHPTRSSTLFPACHDPVEASTPL